MCLNEGLGMLSVGVYSDPRSVFSWRLIPSLWLNHRSTCRKVIVPTPKAPHNIVPTVLVSDALQWLLVLPASKVFLQKRRFFWSPNWKHQHLLSVLQTKKKKNNPHKIHSFHELKSFIAWKGSGEDRVGFYLIEVFDSPLHFAGTVNVSSAHVLVAHLM